VLEKQLEGKDYLLGEYTIADIATYSWVRSYEWAGLNIDHLPNVKRWLKVNEERPAVQKGLLNPPRPTDVTKIQQTAKNLLV